MPFERGSLSLRWYHLARPLPSDTADRLREHACPDPEASGNQLVRGWVTGRHLLDRDLREETVRVGALWRFTLATAQRKIPAALLRAHVQREIQVHLAASPHGRVSRSQRQEIRQMVTERLLPTMPYQLSGIDLVHIPETPWLFSTATSAAQNDVLVAQWSATFGVAPDPMIPESLAALRRPGISASWRPVSFAPEVADDACEVQPGHEFLTWLWHAAETGPGVFDLPGVGEIGVLVEGPLTFAREGSGAHETVLRRGEPTQSLEAKAALLAGKKLKSARLTFARGDEQWAAQFNAAEFTAGALRLPNPESSDPVGRLEDRATLLDTWREILTALVDRFLDLRDSASDWSATRRAMQDWVRSRSERK